MKADLPSEQVLDELKRYTQGLLSFFDSEASVKISTNQSGSVGLEVVCRTLMSEHQVNLIALKRIVSARMNFPIDVKLKHKEDPSVKLKTDI